MDSISQEHDMQLEIQRREQDFQKEVEVKWHKLETLLLHDRHMSRKREVRKVLKKQQSKQKKVRRIREGTVEGEFIKQNALDDLEAAR